jgi:hypothetical protein
MIGAMIPIAIGAGVLFTALCLFGMGAGFWLSWQWPALPLWGSFLISGGVIAAIGICLLVTGKATLDRARLSPDTALQGLKENLQWKTKK